MADIITFPGWTRLPIAVQAVLDGATGCSAVLVLGEDADGQFYAASSVADVQTLLWWLETCRHKLLAGDYTSG